MCYVLHLLLTGIIWPRASLRSADGGWPAEGTSQVSRRNTLHQRQRPLLLWWPVRRGQTGCAGQCWGELCATLGVSVLLSLGIRNSYLICIVVFGIQDQCVELYCCHQEHWVDLCCCLLSSGVVCLFVLFVFSLLGAMG